MGSSDITPDSADAIARMREDRGRRKCGRLCNMYCHPDSAVRVRNDLLRWIMGFSSLTRMGWELTNNGRLTVAITSLNS